MEQPGFRILPRRDTDRALVELFKGLPASIISDDLSRMTGTPAEAKAAAEASRKKAEAEAHTLDSIAERACDDAWIDQALKARGVKV